jgi:predicted transcriptional regulator of viral defense system
MKSAAEFIDHQAATGRLHFTTGEAREALGSSLAAVRGALRRLEKKGAIAAPYRGFHVIVPPEYRSLGCLPPDQFIPDLMKHLGLRYYAGLLTAAEYHGSAHHRPQRFQVVVARNRRPLRCGSVQVEFIARHDFEQTSTKAVNTPRGTLLLSSPEATALELVGYAHRCGGLDNVATVLAELAEFLDPVKLRAAAKLCPVSWVQRLGFLLEKAGKKRLAQEIHPFVHQRAHAITPLVRNAPRREVPRSNRWRLLVNAHVEPEA